MPAAARGGESAAAPAVKAAFADLLTQFLDVLQSSGVVPAGGGAEATAEGAAQPASGGAPKESAKAAPGDSDLSVGEDAGLLGDTGKETDGENVPSRQPSLDGTGSPGGWVWSAQTAAAPEASRLPLTLTFTPRLNPQTGTENKADGASGGTEVREGTLPSPIPPSSADPAQTARLSRMLPSPPPTRLQMAPQPAAASDAADSFHLAFGALIQQQERTSNEGGSGRQNHPEGQKPVPAAPAQPGREANPTPGQAPAAALSPVNGKPPHEDPGSRAASQQPRTDQKADSPARPAPVPERKADESRHDASGPPAPAPPAHPVTTPVATGPGAGVEAARPRPEPRPVTPSAVPIAEAPKEIRSSSPLANAISLSIGEGGRDRVEVRVQERQGAVQVAVRSSDPELTSSLRGNLNDLVGRLENHGYKAETWAPAESSPLRPAQPSASADHRGDTSQGNPQSGGGDGRQPEGEGRRGREQPRPQWLEEFETSAKGRKS